MKNYDIVIVGSGFTGLYMTHRLMTKYPEKQILIIEKAPRIGGRILTENRYGHVLEYGPMRFEPDLQPLFAELLKELEIKTKVFPPYTSPFKAPSYNDITFQEIQAIETDKTLSPAFALLKYALKNILTEQWDLDNDDIKDPMRDERKAWLKMYGKFQGTYLYKLGLWDTLAHILSKPAIDYVMQNGTFYHMIAVNPNAADIISFILDILATCRYNLITVDNSGGTYTIIERLYNKVSKIPRVEILTNTQVTDFLESDRGNEVILCLDGRRTITCNRAIFTCQKSGLTSMTGFESYPSIKSTLESVFVIKLYKIFVILENPPWTESTIPPPNFRADRIPCREVHYSYNPDNKTGMVMIYGDVPTLHYWRAFLDYSQNEYQPQRKNERLKDHMNHYLRNMFKEHRHFNIIDYGILDWSSQPYSTGVHMWRPGFNSAEVSKSMSSFGKRNQLHIAGETYSTYQGFIEGCIRSADAVLGSLL